MPTLAEHADRRGRLKSEIPARIASGESLRAACAAAGVHIGLVCHWATKDPGFRALLDESQRRGAWLRRQAFHDDQARVFLARLAAGESLGALQRDPSMPNRDTLRYWRMTQGEFGAEVLRLIGLHKAERVRRHLRRQPPDWNEALADRVLLLVGRGHPCRGLRKLDPALPAGRVIDRWRRERPQFDVEFRVNMRMGRLARGLSRRKAVLEPLLDGIVCGGSLNSLGGTDGLPSRETLYRWVARDPAFAREIAEACDHREDWYRDQLQEIADEAGCLGVAEARRRMAPLSRQLGQLKKRPGKKWLG